MNSGVDDPVGQKDFARALGIGFGQIVNQSDTTGTRALGGVLLLKYIHRQPHNQKSRTPTTIFIEINTELNRRMLQWGPGLVDSRLASKFAVFLMKNGFSR